MLKTIPLINIRHATPVALVESHGEGAKDLIRASREAFGIASRIGSHFALPIGDMMAKKWLEKVQNPYAAEIAGYNRILNTRGVYALNIAYEWGCTSGAYATNDSVTLTRVLDWPFKRLGANLIVAHMTGKGGDFYNITWPAVSPMIQGFAPGKYAAALNQAPMRRFKQGIYRNWLTNRRIFFRQRALPPGHLLRHTFETASTYYEAKQMLATLPVALPAIYTLTGTKPGEGCVIERLENHAYIRELGNGTQVSTANHFESYLNGVGYGWLPRAIESHARAAHACYTVPDEDFGWFKAPIANELSRVAFVADAVKGTLSLIGTEGATPVTEVFRL